MKYIVPESDRFTYNKIKENYKNEVKTIIKFSNSINSKKFAEHVSILMNFNPIITFIGFYPKIKGKDALSQQHNYTIYYDHHRVLFCQNTFKFT